MTPDDKLFTLLVERLRGLEKRADRAERETHRIREEIGAVKDELQERVHSLETKSQLTDQTSSFLGSKIALIMSWLAAAAAVVVAIFKDKLFP